MASTSFDTYRAVQQLKSAGADEALAKAVTDVIRESRDFDLSVLATKQDLQILEQRMTIKLGAMLVVAIGAVATLVKLL